MSNPMPFEEWLQSRLTAHGFPVGPIDGIIGGNMIAAIETFQKAHNLPVTSKADAATVAALRLSSSVITQDVATSIPKRDVESESPSPPAIKNNWPRQKDCMTFYGNVGTNQTSIEIPFDMYLAWSKSTRVTKMTLNKKVAPSAERVFHRVAEIFSPKERQDLGLTLFGGSLNVRKMRGGSSYSMHSWGIAIDFDPERNGLNVHKPNARLSHDDAIPFWKEWEKEGWLSLGRARNFDWMHVQAALL